MLQLVFTPTQIPTRYKWTLPGSKSLSHRYLVARQLYAPGCHLKNLSNSSDTQALEAGLAHPSHVYFEDGATPLRFFVALAAALSWSSEVDAGARLRQRPIAALLEGLGLNPLKEFPYRISGTLVPRLLWEVSTQESSQYLSAILLVAPYVHGKGNPCQVRYPQEFPSKPYADMTLKVLEEFGVTHSLDGEILTLTWTNAPAPTEIGIEPDWSSAAFVYNICLALPGTVIELPGLRTQSWQGDSLIQEPYAALGIGTRETDDGLAIHPNPSNQDRGPFDINLSQMPDAAPALACAFAYQNRSVCLSGLENLALKESNRIEALMHNFSALGIVHHYSEGRMFLQQQEKQILRSATIETFRDHRIAMAFAPFAKRIPLKFSETQSVNKSFPHFWEGLQDLNFDWK